MNLFYYLWIFFGFMFYVSQSRFKNIIQYVTLCHYNAKAQGTLASVTENRVVVS